MSMESANAARVDTPVTEEPEQWPMKSIFSRAGAHGDPATGDNGNSELPPWQNARERAEPFAHDINAKIDTLEQQVHDTTRQHGRAQEQLQGALDELTDRLNGLKADSNERLTRQREELRAISSLVGQQGQSLEALHQAQHESSESLRQQQREISAQHQVLDAQQHALLDIRNQFHAQQEAIGHQEETLQLQAQTLRTADDALGVHAKTLSLHQEQLQAHTGHLQSLDNEQAFLQQHLSGLSEEHDATRGRVDALADQLYAANVQAQTRHRQTHRHINTLGVALAGSSIVLLGLLTWFQFNPVAAPAELETRIETLAGAVDTQRAQGERHEAGISAIGTSLGALENNVRTLGDSQRQLLDGSSARQEELQQATRRLQAAEASLGEIRSQLQRALNPRSNASGPSAGSGNGGATGLRDARWINGRIPGHYTIQLVASQNQGNLVNFAAQHRNSLRQYPLAHAVTRENGQRWHRLVYGDFATEQQARKAIAQLPASLRNTKPWVRQIRSVQQG